jgi:hypothetical protein
MKKYAVVFVLAAFAACVSFAEDFSQNVNFKGDVNFDKGAKWMIEGTEVTATAANLNSGVASSTANLISNATLKVYGSNIVTVSGGAATLGGTLAVTGATTLTGNLTETGTATINGAGGILLSTNVVIVAGQFANRSALVVSTVTSNLPVGSLVLAGPGKAYLRTGATAATNSWSTFTTGNVE